MAWFAAHAVMYFRFKDGKQDCYPVWENVYLIEAQDSEQARQKGCDRARLDEGDSGGTLRLGNRMASLVFAGLRKLICVSHQGEEGQPADGDEVTFTEFRLVDSASFENFVSGRESSIVCVE